MDKPANLPASILARLRNVAREKQMDYQLILRRYAIERLLHRLGISPLVERQARPSAAKPAIADSQSGSV